MYHKDTQHWIDIDSFQGQVLSLATFKNWLYVGGQFTPSKNQSASLAIYDLSNNNVIVGVHGVFGNIVFLKKTHSIYIYL